MSGMILMFEAEISAGIRSLRTADRRRDLVVIVDGFHPNERPGPTEAFERRLRADGWRVERVSADGPEGAATLTSALRSVIARNRPERIVALAPEDAGMKRRLERLAADYRRIVDILDREREPDFLDRFELEPA